MACYFLGLLGFTKFLLTSRKRTNKASQGLPESFFHVPAFQEVSKNLVNPNKPTNQQTYG